MSKRQVVIIAAIAALGFGVASRADSQSWTSSSTSTPYACDGVPEVEPVGPGDAAIVAPVRAVAAQLGVVDAAFLARVVDAVQRSEHAAALHEPSTADRVRLQHELLRIAEFLEPHRHATTRSSAVGDAYDRVMALVTRTAPTAAALEALGAPSQPALAGLLGAASETVDRATETCTRGGRLMHARYAAGLLAYRPLRNGMT